jgi:hypothetical protein
MRAAGRVIQLLADIVVGVQEPQAMRPIEEALAASPPYRVRRELKYGMEIELDSGKGRR